MRTPAAIALVVILSERNNVEARLSPDGATFAIIYDPSPVACPGLYRIGSDGSHLATITPCEVAGAPAAHPDWAP